MSVRAKRGIIVSVAVVLLTVVGVAVASRQLKPVEQPVPTTRVERGDLEIDVVTPGEFRAPHSALACDLRLSTGLPKHHRSRRSRWYDLISYRRGGG